MEKMIDLKDLLKHEILDLYSVEQQIIDAMPAMIEKAKSQELKDQLQKHLTVTEEQKLRLEEIQQLLNENSGAESTVANAAEKNEEEQTAVDNSGEGTEDEQKDNGSTSDQEAGSEEKSVSKDTKPQAVKVEKCIGMEGILKEGNKVLNANMSEKVIDAVIIACAQKVEHYEICGYGTAAAYARELQLSDVEALLVKTLNEEYEADDSLTQLAVGNLNIKAEGLTRERMTNKKTSVLKSGNNKAYSANAKQNGTPSKKPATKKAVTPKADVKSSRIKASKPAPASTIGKSKVRGKSGAAAKSVAAKPSILSVKGKRGRPAAAKATAPTRGRKAAAAGRPVSSKIATPVPARKAINIAKPLVKGKNAAKPAGRKAGRPAASSSVSKTPVGRPAKNATASFGRKGNIKSTPVKGKSVVSKPAPAAKKAVAGKKAKGFNRVAPKPVKAASKVAAPKKAAPSKRGRPALVSNKKAAPKAAKSVGKQRK